MRRHLSYRAETAVIHRITSVAAQQVWLCSHECKGAYRPLLRSLRFSTMQLANKGKCSDQDKQGGDSQGPAVLLSSGDEPTRKGGANPGHAFFHSCSASAGFKALVKALALGLNVLKAFCRG